VLHYLDKTLGTGDFVAIYYIDSSLHMALPFTNDLQKARETLQRIETRRSGGTFSGRTVPVAQEEINDLYRQAHPRRRLELSLETYRAVAAVRGAVLEPANNMAMMMETPD